MSAALHWGLPAVLRQRLAEGAEALNVTLQAAQIDQLLAYLALLQQWTKVYNLTAVRDAEGILVQHLMDSLAVLPALRRRTAATPTRLLDVGSGAGLPGLALAIAAPELQITCVDAVAKKAGFMSQVIAELGLHRAHARHARIEDFSTVERWEVITSRAFASLGDFVRLTGPVLAPGGCWMALKGKHPTDEIAVLPPNIETFHVEPLAVPGLEADRCLVWMRPRDHNPCR